MSDSIHRRDFLNHMAVGSLALASSSFVPTSARSRGPKGRPLPILNLVDTSKASGDRIGLTLHSAQHDFGNGTKSDTFGINQTYLGPVVRVKSGDTIPFKVANMIDEPVAVHWHGLHIPGVVDGGPHQEIEAGRVWQPDVPITQLLP